MNLIYLLCPEKIMAHNAWVWIVSTEKRAGVDKILPFEPTATSRIASIFHCFVLTEVTLEIAKDLG